MALETVQIQLTPQLREELEEAARALNLSLSAFLVYLVERQRPAIDAARLDRHVREVFGRHGELMRRLAK